MLSHFLIATVLSHFLIATVLSHPALIQGPVIPHCYSIQSFYTATMLSHSLCHSMGGNWLGRGRRACGRRLAAQLLVRVGSSRAGGAHGRGGG
jgi:hypothetical protein